jgi:long-subunit fatty acid transport protein
MKRIVSFLVPSIVVTAALIAGDPATYTFLRNDAGARAAAMNGSFVSVTDDPNVVFYNPASLATITTNQLSLGYFKHILDINGGTCAATYALENAGVFGFGISFLDYGSFNQTDPDFNILGTFGARDIAFSGGYGFWYDQNIAVGGNVGFVFSSIGDYQSSAITFDAGILYYLPEERLSVGASILHVGTQLSTYSGTTEPLPVDLKVGLSYRPEHLPVLLNLNFHKLLDEQDSFIERLRSFTVGAEFTMSKSVRIRGGYNNQERKDFKLGTSSGLGGFSFGGGLILGKYKVDYALNALGKMGNLHRFSLTFDI